VEDSPRFRQELVALFGQPVDENPTQVMIEAAFRAAGLDWRYLTIEVAPSGIGDAVRGLRAMGMRGANCTLPHKVAVIEHLDALSPEARAIGAVNCIVNEAGRFVGHNTDGRGFLESLRTVADPAGQKVVILGAGGAARAIGVELALAGAGRITIVNRGDERGRALAAHLIATGGNADFQPLDGDLRLPPSTGIFVNATSIGLFPGVEARVPIALETLRPDMVVADVIPNPPRTRLVREAEARGCTVLDGLGMLVNQGVIGIRLWTGREPDARVMRAALEAVFNPPAHG
jgi:shikimate dehydrogenase